MGKSVKKENIYFMLAFYLTEGMTDDYLLSLHPVGQLCWFKQKVVV